MLPHLTKRVVKASPKALADLLRARTLELPVYSAEEAVVVPAAAATASDLTNLIVQLASLHPNGSCIVACDNGVGTARCAVAMMKFTDKAVLYITNGERMQLLEDLQAYYVDPPIQEQLQPLPTSELIRRASSQSSGGVDAESEVRREHALNALCERYLTCPRTELRRRGVPLPHALATRLLASLRELKWPTSSARPGVTADEYLVFSTRRSASECGTRHPHYTLRVLCEQLVEWYRKECDDESFDFNGIAVTRNFVGSPHIDRFDTGLQLAVSLGDFTGGELCVEAAEEDAIEVVDTRGRIAKVDGRKVHWVRAFTGGERFSLIFYTAAPASASVS